MKNKISILFVLFSPAVFSQIIPKIVNVNIDSHNIARSTKVITYTQKQTFNSLSENQEVTLVSPYVTKSYVYKGQLHCHSTNSMDGLYSPTDVVNAYKHAGYNFVALSDHDTVTHDPGVSDILFIEGVEEWDGGYHLGRVNVTSAIGGYANHNIYQPQAIIDSTVANGGFVTVNHPYAHNSEWPWSRMESLDRYDAVEIWNSMASLKYGNAEPRIDSLLSLGRRFYFTATDDMHDTTSGAAKTASVKVFANALTNAEIMENLKHGNFYASGGANISAITVSDNIITVETDAPSTIDFIVNNGVVAQTNTSATSANYAVSGDEVYVRARVIRNSDGLKAWTNAIFVSSSVDRTVIVAQDGSGNYTTIQEAFQSVPINYLGKWTIFVKKGKYRERVTLPTGKGNVILIGEERDSTIIWNDISVAESGGTSAPVVMVIEANDFVAKNITIANTYWPNKRGTVSSTQGIALLVQGDRHQYINCVIDGYQNTYCASGGSSTKTGRMYHKNCIIRGTNDYIYGMNICVFDSCTLVSMNQDAVITAANTELTSQYGFVFRNCALQTNSSSYTDTAQYVHQVVTSFYLGHPSQNGPRTVYINCYEPVTLAPIGWTTMQTNPSLYAEYNCYGPGSKKSRGAVSAWPIADQPRQLTQTESALYSLSNIFSKSSATSALISEDWMPSYATPEDNMPTGTGLEAVHELVGIPKSYSLFQNYPNPFNPLTTISFIIPKLSHVKLVVYDVYGREVAILVDGMRSAGMYKENFDGSRFSSGVYLARLKADVFDQTIKLLLMK